MGLTLLILCSCLGSVLTTLKILALKRCIRYPFAIRLTFWTTFELRHPLTFLMAAGVEVPRNRVSNLSLRAWLPSYRFEVATYLFVVTVVVRFIIASRLWCLCVPMCSM